MIDEIKVILLDIEGTTTPIDFVHQTLFPYARERMIEFVRTNFDSLSDEISRLKTEHESDTTYASPFDDRSPDSVAAYLCHLIDNDRKSTPLKSIQGKIWKSGYDEGEICSQVFDDVPPAFKRWKAAGKHIAIYSSGSIEAQKDLFKHTDHGDLTPFISAYFDTTIGGKKEMDSYSKIVDQLGVGPNNVLFVSDVVAELDAARSGGLRTTLSIREGNAVYRSESLHASVESLDDLDY